LIWSSIFRSGPALRGGGGGGGGASTTILGNSNSKRLSAIVVATDTQTHRQSSWSIGLDPPLYTHMPLPVLRSHTPGRRPRTPVKTGARVRCFRGCNYMYRGSTKKTWLSRAIPSGSMPLAREFRFPPPHTHWGDWIFILVVSKRCKFHIFPHVHRRARRWTALLSFLAIISPGNCDFEKVRFSGALHAPASRGPRCRSRRPCASVSQLRCSGALWTGPALPLLSLAHRILSPCSGAARSSIALVAHAPRALVSRRPRYPRRRSCRSRTPRSRLA